LNATQRRTGVTASAEGETTPTAPAETAAYGGSGQGGGIYLAAGKITFIQGAVMQNTAIKGKGGSETAKDGKAEKGGVFVEEGATFKAVRSTISGNKP
jgi:hypothetical protein